MNTRTVSNGAVVAKHTADEQAALNWLETKDHQRAWDRLVGRRIRGVREEIQQKEQGERKAKANERLSPEPIWLRTSTVSSQQAVARCVARTQSWLSKLERGERSISVGDAYLFAKHFDVDPLRIVGPPSPAERERLDRDAADIRRAREKAGVIAEKVVERQAKARNHRRRATKLNRSEERKRRG